MDELRKAIINLVDLDNHEMGEVSSWTHDIVEAFNKIVLPPAQISETEDNH